MGKIAGRDCKLYIRTTGSIGDAFDINDFSEVDATDNTLNMEAAEIDANSRLNNGWEAALAGLKNSAVDTSIPWDTTKDYFTTIQTAFLAGAAVELYVMDGGPLSGTGYQGLHASFAVLNFSRNENLNDMVTATTSFKADGDAITPEWVTSPIS